MKGRPPKPTKLKKMSGTDQPCRVRDDEMEVAQVIQIPDPPMNLSNQGMREWKIITAELYAKQMLYEVDLSLVAAYCNEMGLYIETEKILRERGRVDEFYDDDGALIRRLSKPEQKIAKDALNAALKLASQFGLTPSARTRIAMPTMEPQTFTL